ncbi:TetR/AcrR family transcriptional regulator [Streptomyces sp. NPDC090109]|uniref:TetR/AcrR family transcriptional regulator n=1 Tax=Streptomyces sp. NPDC090109 TaxID=3365948 RepID=UPI0038241FFE
MGHKEDLLEGAKRCLLEKGCGQTTARDIVAASGTNLACIGYRYGSKDALLQQAFLAVTEEWGERVGPAGTGELPADPYRRFHAAWEQVIAEVEGSRPVWKLGTEAVTRLDDEKLQEAIKEPQCESGLGIDPETDPEEARVVGLLPGPRDGRDDPVDDRPATMAPTANDLAEGLKVLMGERS